LKTEQDRPTFTTEYYIEVGSCDSVAAFRSSPDASLQWGRLSPSQESMVVFHLFIAGGEGLLIADYLGGEGNLRPRRPPREYLGEYTS